MASREIIIWPTRGRKRVQEQSEQSFEVKFLSALVASAPTTARYKITNLNTGEVAKDWTAISTPSATETVSVSGSINTIRAGLDEETYELIVQSDYDDATIRQTQVYRYKVVNNTGVTT